MLFWSIFFILRLVLTHDIIVPEFESVPPHVTYVSPEAVNRTNPLVIGCRAWPITNSLSYLYSVNNNVGSPPQLHPLPVNLVELRQDQLMYVTHPNALEQLIDRDLYCLVNTSSLSMTTMARLSRPFRLTRATTFPPQSTSTHSTSPQSILVEDSSLAVIPCHAPPSQPPARISFLADSKVIASTDDRSVSSSSDKFLIASSPELDYHQLLIKDFGPDDQDVYRCSALNPVTNDQWTDRSGYRLSLQAKTASSSQTLIFGLVGSHVLASSESNSSSPHHELVKQGANISLLCRSEASPKVSIRRWVGDKAVAIHDNSQTFAREFGVLLITNVSTRDQGRYECRDSVGNSASLSLRVDESRLIARILRDKSSTTTLGSSFDLIGETSSKQTISSSYWLFNGRVRQGEVRGSNSSLLRIAHITESDYGLYQFVATRQEGEGDWIDATTVIANPVDDCVIGKADFDRFLDLSQPPDQQQSITDHSKLRLARGELANLSCMPPPEPSNQAYIQLSNLLPGCSSTSNLTNRLALAYDLGVKVESSWHKDGIPIELGQQSLSFTLSVSRSSDFGLYECQLMLSGDVRHSRPLFKRRIELVDSQVQKPQQSRVEKDSQYSHSPNQQGDPLVDSFGYPPFFDDDHEDGHHHQPSSSVGHPLVPIESYEKRFNRQLPDVDNSRRGNSQQAVNRRHQQQRPPDKPSRRRPSFTVDDAFEPVGSRFNYQRQPFGAAPASGGGVSQERFPSHRLPPPAQPLLGGGLPFESDYAGALPSPQSPIRIDQPPEAVISGDNLAVGVYWYSIPSDYYRVQYRKKVPNSGGDPWSPPVLVDTRIEECCNRDPACCGKKRRLFITHRPSDGLEPGRLYQFRVWTYHSGQQQRPQPSPWSRPVSFEHIADVAPVIIDKSRLADGAMLIRWQLSAATVGFPIDHFLLLYRPVVRGRLGQLEHGNFSHLLVPGNQRQFKLTQLESGKGYQIVVYGVHTPPGHDPVSSAFTGGLNGRRITRFSHEVYVKPGPVDSPADVVVDKRDRQQQSITASTDQSQSTFNNTASNKSMFIILGLLAGLMLLILLCLIGACLWRQRRFSKQQQKPSPGVKKTRPDSYYSHTTPQGQIMLDQMTGLVASDHQMDPNSPYNYDDDAGQHYRAPSQMSVGGGPQSPPPINPPPPPPPVHFMSQLDYYSHHHQRPGCQSVLGSPLNSPPQQPYQQHWQTMRPNYPSVAKQMTSPPHMPSPQQQYQYYQQQQQPSSVYWQHQPGGGLQLLPLGLKREPPSGGSVHDATDDETTAGGAGMTDSALASNSYNHNNQMTSSLTSNPLIMTPGPAAPYGQQHFPGNYYRQVPPYNVEYYPNQDDCNTPLLLNGNHQPVYDYRHQQVWLGQSGYNPGLGTPPPPSGNAVVASSHQQWPSTNEVPIDGNGTAVYHQSTERSHRVKRKRRSTNSSDSRSGQLKQQNPTGYAMESIAPVQQQPIDSSNYTTRHSSNNSLGQYARHCQHPLPQSTVNSSEQQESKTNGPVGYGNHNPVATRLYSGGSLSRPLPPTSVASPGHPPVVRDYSEYGIPPNGVAAVVDHN